MEAAFSIQGVKMSLTNHQFIRLLQILRRDRVVQLPGDVHGVAAGMPDIVCGSQEGIGGCANDVILEFPDEEQNFAAPAAVIDVPLAHGAGVICGGLALPMEQFLVDGVIVIHGRGGVVFIGLIQGHEEYIDLFVRQPFHAFTDAAGIHEVHGHQQLVAGIGTMQIQRTVETQVHRGVNEIDAIQLITQQLLELREHHRAVSQSVEIVENLVVIPRGCRFSPNGDVEHLHHPLFHGGQCVKICIIQIGQDFQQEINPAAGINGAQTAHGLGQNRFHRFLEISLYTGGNAQTGEAVFGIDRPYVESIVSYEIREGQGQTAVFFKSS